MGWPLNLSVIWRQAPRFFRGLTGYTYSEGTGPLEKSAALYQKDFGATTIGVQSIHKKALFHPANALDKGWHRFLPLVAENRPYRQSRLFTARRSLKNGHHCAPKKQKGDSHL
ncbi:hypothetical protein HU718_000105 [Pseudomonas tensinigenes]|uniref:Uncharacterized protein n=1 Tax=Pseudomonas tensinigenes TaxID=2745511 RepID=A0ABX8PYF4_9PSED|nr:hypothetical protein [Pseudomonas tensinigenes]QXI06131.1 hypothetical protein HU718_000105 [Pseudomonas tensinigenes]